METIIAALVSGGCAVLGSYFVYLGKLNKIVDSQQQAEKAIDGLGHSATDNRKELSSEHKELSSEHKGLSSEHKGLFLEHMRLSEKNSKLLSTATGISLQTDLIGAQVDQIKNLIYESKIEQEKKYNSLKDNHKQMIDNVSTGASSFKAIEKELLDINYKYNKEIETNDRITGKLENLLLTIEQIKGENELLRKENKNIQEQYNGLYNEYNKLLSMQKNKNRDRDWGMDR